MVDILNGNADINEPTPTIQELADRKEARERASNEQIKEWNERNGGKGVRVIRKWKFNFWKFFGIIGLLCFILISIAIGLWGYKGYAYGFNNPISLACGSLNITLPQCPDFPATPECPTLECPDVYLNTTCNPILQCGNQS